jgi:hypothetical protein
MNRFTHRVLMTRRRWLKQVQYYLKRHPVPLTRYGRRAVSTGPRIFANSIPKAGTNLLKRTVNLLPFVVPRWTYHLDEKMPGTMKQLQFVHRGQAVTAHMGWSGELMDLLRSRGFSILFILRDPRDVLVSFVDHVTRQDPSHLLHAYFNTLPSDDERLMASIHGVDGRYLPHGTPLPAVGEQLGAYLPWLDEPACLTFSFEDLVGSAGGGDDAKQLQTVTAIVEHLGLKASRREIEDLAGSVFHRKSRTFRKGRIKDWPNHFTAWHKAAFKESAGDTLIRLGYETGNDW